MWRTSVRYCCITGLSHRASARPGRRKDDVNYLAGGAVWGVDDERWRRFQPLLDLGRRKVRLSRKDQRGSTGYDRRRVRCTGRQRLAVVIVTAINRWQDVVRRR